MGEEGVEEMIKLPMIGEEGVGPEKVTGGDQERGKDAMGDEKGGENEGGVRMAE